MVELGVSEQNFEKYGHGEAVSEACCPACSQDHNDGFVSGARTWQFPISNENKVSFGS